MPVLRPSVGFCIQTASESGSGRWYVNMCKHKMCEMPIAYSGRPVSRDFILTHGIGSMQVPFDIGSFRKLKQRADGAKDTTYCIDVVFNPLIVQLFTEDDFCNKMEEYRPFVINLAFKRIEESTGVRLSKEKIKLVKKLRYKDGETGDDTTPREFAELAGDKDCFDEEVPRAAPVKSDEPEAEPLIQDITPGYQKPALRKGFLNNSKAKGSLYGENGSGEGVLPENAGDPLGYIPKKLRNTCKIVDCNSPEYQENERKNKATAEQNQMSDALRKDMEKWCKKATPDKWEEDLPDGRDASEVQKYNTDYSRFDLIDDVEEPTVREERDWYIDSSGERRRIPATGSQTSANSASELADPAGVKKSTSDGIAAKPAVKKGFLGDAKSPLYPEGSNQTKAPVSEDQIIKDLMAQKGLSQEHWSEDMIRQSKSEKSVEARTPSFKAPDFEVKHGPDALQLVVSVPTLESMEDVSLDVEARSASLKFPLSAKLTPLKVALPEAVVANKVKAKFSRKTKQITVSLPRAEPTA